jgi:hypothetical protein
VGGDDGCDLSLSTDEHEANSTVLASVSGNTRCVSAWMCVSVDVCQRGCVDAWMRGCVASWCWWLDVVGMHHAPPLRVPLPPTLQAATPRCADLRCAPLTTRWDFFKYHLQAGQISSRRLLIGGKRYFFRMRHFEVGGWRRALQFAAVCGLCAGCVQPLPSTPPLHTWPLLEGTAGSRRAAVQGRVAEKIPAPPLGCPLCAWR